MRRTIQNVALFGTALLAGLTRLGSKFSRRIKKSITIVAVVATTVLAGHIVSAQVTSPQAPPSLKSVKVPEPDNLDDFIRNKTAAIALGKALFWDMQVGSDGIQSCASCHFHAGVDNRSKNQIHPGPDTTFNTGGGPNYQLTAADYPFHNLTDPNNRDSPLFRPDSNDVTGSQGVFKTKFKAINPASAEDQVEVQPDPVFNVNGTNVRQVTGRNAPTTINAVHNFRQFWDGRAENVFNGQNPLGSRDPDAAVLKSGGLLYTQVNSVKVSLKNASLASQAVGPPTNNVEVSADGRQFKDIGQKLSRETGKKLRALKPLGKQLVSPDDSVLGSSSNGSKPGLKTTYTQMIKAAFKPEWWKSNQLITIGPDKYIRLGDTLSNFLTSILAGLRVDLDGVVDAIDLKPNQFTMMDYNFPLFMGLAIQMYESTLVSDNSPYDQYREGNTSALTPQQERGLELFLKPTNQGGAGCIFCHSGAEFTSASVANVKASGRIASFGSFRFDTGFFNIGVRPSQEDQGVGNNDQFGNPLSEAKLAQQGKYQQIFGEAPNVTVSSDNTVLADALFKTPTLRNVELTAPYFHNGGKLTLRQVVDFYNRGGDFPGGVLAALNLSEDDKQALVEFMKGLTDERVRYERAPFDHPQLFYPDGHPGNQNSVTNDGTGQATDSLDEIPAVGRNGRSTPELNFLE